MSYIEFTEVKDYRTTKTKQFYIWNKNDPNLILGYISFYPQWRKYIFHPEQIKSIFDASCLREIADFCELQTSQWKEELKK